MRDLMTTREVAEYLRIKERKVYELVRRKDIPCTRVTGKWLFPRHLIDLWVTEGAEGPSRAAREPAPAVYAGSHDPLLEWCVRESGCQLAMLTGGSLDGIGRLAAGEAQVCGVHVPSSEVEDGDRSDDDAFNVELVGQACAGRDVVLVEWAWREQGLVLAAGNPLGIAGLGDLKQAAARIVVRQSEAGSHVLLTQLLGAAGLDLEDLNKIDPPARSESDVAAAILEDRADAGFAIAAAARQSRLDFLPLARERFDLLIRRRDYFDAPVQTLLAFAVTEAPRARAAELGGYELRHPGRVVFNPA